MLLNINFHYIPVANIVVFTALLMAKFTLQMGILKPVIGV